MFAVGSRYTYSPKLRVGKRPGIAVFGEGLFDGIHGYLIEIGLGVRRQIGIPGEVLS
jgi:hypothetical protein